MKQKIRSHISIALLVLILLPMVEKVIHELGHLSGPHCGIEQTHFCQQKHFCAICDYIFSASAAIIPDEVSGSKRFIFVEVCNVKITIAAAISSRKYVSFSRGPPVV